MRFHSLKDIENKVPKKGSFKHVLMQVEAAGVGIVTKQNTGKISDPRSNDEVAKVLGNRGWKPKPMRQ